MRWAFVIVVVTGCLGLVTAAQGQANYTYTAETDQPARRKGEVIAGALRWECIGSRCTIHGKWPALGVDTCRALDHVVGPLKSFGRPGARLAAADLAKCNAAPTGGVVIVGTPRAPTARFGTCDDCDGDGHHSPTAPLIVRRDPETGDDTRISYPGDDCDDADPNRYPGNTEVCDPDGLDEDCVAETIGNKDEDGDGHIDAFCRAVIGGAQLFTGDDCDDTRAGVHPGLPELCNGFDDDCNGLIDAADELAGLAVWLWEDRDRDGFGETGGLVSRMCGIGDLRGFSINDYDCDDTDPRRHPGNGCL